MKRNLAHARDDDAARSAAVQWLEGYDPGDGHGPVGDQARDPLSMFTTEVVLDAFMGGVAHADQDFAVERSTGHTVGTETPGEGTVVAHAEPNVRPVQDPLVLEGLMAAAGLLDATARPLSVVSDGVFRLQTPDPRFSPAQPVRVNGYLFHPATEA